MIIIYLVVSGVQMVHEVLKKKIPAIGQVSRNVGCSFVDFFLKIWILLFGEECDRP